MSEVPAKPAPPHEGAPRAAGASPTGARRSRRWLAASVAVVLAAGALVALRGRLSGGSPAPASPGAQPRPVPVLTAIVARRDVPLFLEGLGNVAAYRTVTVRPQVDGRLEQVLFREGQAVRKGQVLAQIDPRPFRIQLQQAEGALARDQAQLENARRNVSRARQLVAEKLISQQQLDTDTALAGQLEGAVQMDKAAIETARLNLDYARITAPIDGVTGIRLVDQGNVVRASDPTGIVVITQLDPIAVLFNLPQDQLAPVSEQLSRGPLGIEAFSRDGSTVLGRGQVELIDNQINQATSTIRLKAIVPNPRRQLWPNQFVNVRLHLKTRAGALVLPATAVQRGPTGTFVYVVRSDLTAAPRPVEIETIQADAAILARGLEEGERVVVEGQNQLKPGSRVVIREPRRPPAPSVAGDASEASLPRGGVPAR